MSDSQAETLGTVASSITSNFSNVAKLLTSASYLAGLGFSVAAIVKFKGHKDNPNQLPVSTPDVLAAVSAIETYLSSLETQATAQG